MNNPPFNNWLITNLGRIMITIYSPNGDEEYITYIRSGKQYFEDYQFYLIVDDINPRLKNINKYLSTFSDEITEWELLK